MKIYSMTATFGKLENQTLPLKDGLNILSRPNEWGKSTWCSFLVAMLYGIETRAKTTKTALADKERFAPWSGSPMSGRMDIRWQDRDITIERSTKGRIPLGQFRAYETHSGLEVTELTAENCGRLLLGLERSVFERTAFIRLSDMPVTQDEGLRRQLNALVTTGEDSSDGEVLAEKLRELQNACYVNRSRGKIPETQEKLQSVQNSLDKIEEYHALLHAEEEKQVALQEKIQTFQAHLGHLDYAAYRQQLTRLEGATDLQNRLDAQLFVAQEAIMHCPSREALQQRKAALEALQREEAIQQSRCAALGLPPQAPVPKQSPDSARRHAQEYAELSKKPKALLLPALALAVLAVAAAWQVSPVAAGLCAAVLALAGFALAMQGKKKTARRKARMEELAALYHSTDPAQWVGEAEEYIHQEAAYRQALASYEARREEISARQSSLDGEEALLCPHGTPAQALAECNEQLLSLDKAQRLQEQLQQQMEYVQSLQALLPSQPVVDRESHLTLSREETVHQLGSAEAALQQTMQNQSRYRGALSTLAERGVLEGQKAALEEQLSQLELYQRALALAQDKLQKAKTELQRRFAPQISREAARLFGIITQGRYDRLTLSDDLSLHTSAQGENALHSVLWRSQGTADQLYLCLRLAMAQAMAPGAPLVLDDALAHFDDDRAQAALGVLKELAQDRQIVLMTCHSREE